jgi:hypothetical protein
MFRMHKAEIPAEIGKIVLDRQTDEAKKSEESRKAADKERRERALRQARLGRAGAQRAAALNANFQQRARQTGKDAVASLDAIGSRAPKVDPLPNSVDLNAGPSDVAERIERYYQAQQAAYESIADMGRCLTEILDMLAQFDHNG